MKRKAVKSSNVASVGYSRKVLEVAFKPAKPEAPEAVYRYYDVPAKVAKGLVEAESVGKYLHANIIGRYDAEKVEGE